MPAQPVALALPISWDPDFTSSLERCLKPPCCWSLGTDRGEGVCTSRVVKVKTNCITVDLQVGIACEGALCCKAHWVFLKFFSGGFQSHTRVILPELIMCFQVTRALQSVES